MSRPQISIVTGYHTDGTPYTTLVDRPDLRAEMTQATMGGPEEDAWLDEHAAAIEAIDDRRAELMRLPETRERLVAATLPEWSDWDDLLRAWTIMLDEVEAEVADARWAAGE